MLPETKYADPADRPLTLEEYLRHRASNRHEGHLGIASVTPDGVLIQVHQSAAGRIRFARWMVKGDTLTAVLTEFGK